MRKTAVFVLFLALALSLPVCAKEYVYPDASYGQGANSLREFNYLLLILNSEPSTNYQVLDKSTKDKVWMPADNVAGAWFYSGEGYSVLLNTDSATFYKRAAESIMNVVQGDSRLVLNVDKDGDSYAVKANAMIASYTIMRRHTTFDFEAAKNAQFDRALRPDKLHSSRAAKDLFSADFVWNQKTGVLVGSIKNRWKWGVFGGKNTFVYVGIYRNSNTNADQGLAHHINSIINQPESTAADLRSISQLVNQELDVCTESRQGTGNVLCRVDLSERDALRNAIISDPAKASTLVSAEQIEALAAKDGATATATLKKEKVRW